MCGLDFLQSKFYCLIHLCHIFLKVEFKIIRRRTWTCQYIMVVDYVKKVEKGHNVKATWRRVLSLRRKHLIGRHYI